MLSLSHRLLKVLKIDGISLNDPLQPTIPASSPKRCIDFIFASNYNGYTFETIQTVVEQEYVASDHLPVWVEVRIK